MAQIGTKNSDASGRASFRQRIRIPTRWIEQRIEETIPKLSAVEVSQLEDAHDALVTAEPTGLGSPLVVSYFTGNLKKIASKIGIPSSSLLESLEADLENGITIERKDDWTTIDGQSKTRLIGARWSVVLYPKAGNRSQQALAVLDSVQQLPIPLGRPAFQPDSIQFYAIGSGLDEMPCDLRGLEQSYLECAKARAASEEAGRLLTISRNQRKLQMVRTRQELKRVDLDVALERRGQLHADLEKRYGALRMMMDLLELRSKYDGYLFTAIVIEPSRSNLRIQLTETRGGVLEEGSNVELKSANQQRSCKVLSIERDDSKTTLEFELQESSFQVGEEIRAATMPRFRMWAHQRAVDLLMEEEVHGYWPDLVNMLCDPESLNAPSEVRSPKEFFCDNSFDSPSLSPRQREAVAGALATKNVFCIQGPPGTGKTAVICELVQQLISNGERVLVASTRNIAVNEVLKRIGGAQGIRALRLTADRKKAEDVGEYLPSEIINSFIGKASNSGECAAAQKAEREQTEDAIRLLAKLERSQDAAASARKVAGRAGHMKREAQRLLNTDGVSLSRSLEELEGKIIATLADAESLQLELRRIKASLKNTTDSANEWSRILGKTGLGKIGRERRVRFRHTERLTNVAKYLETLKHEIRAKKDRLRSIQQSALAAERKAEQTDAVYEDYLLMEAKCKAACEINSLLRPEDLRPHVKTGELKPHSARVRRKELIERGSRLGKYQYLRRRFNELVMEATCNSEDLDALQKDLIAVSNLFCCTTTAIAGIPELRGVVVDTFIVDEASLITDSEFLIGAVLARRWILIGDEHQLPPFVEQNDEHFIHALSALHKMEKQDLSLEATVNELGILWKEDEEHRQFRSEEVVSEATRLRDSESWEKIYRTKFKNGVSRLEKKGTDPSRQLLQSMKEHIVHSLFERIVESSNRVQLTEQRRMIEAIAEIVKGPIYGGNYVTPRPESTGIFPLTTDAFKLPITFLDTTGYRNRALNRQQDNGFINEFEANWIVEVCKSIDFDLNKKNAPSIDVSILCFYQAQASHVRRKIDRLSFKRLSKVKCTPIDGMQGQEADLVIISFCRTQTNITRRDVGPNFGRWLQDVRRLNVACTRAKRGLIFVGQKALLMKLCSDGEGKKFYANLDSLLLNHPEMRVMFRLESNV